MTIAKNTICLLYHGEARQAAEFYASVFPDSAVQAVHTAPGRPYRSFFPPGAPDRD